MPPNIFNNRLNMLGGLFVEEKQYAKSHRLLLNNRRTGTVSGVTDVISFDIAEILLETEQGMLTDRKSVV